MDVGVFFERPPAGGLPDPVGTRVVVHQVAHQRPERLRILEREHFLPLGEECGEVGARVHHLGQPHRGQFEGARIASARAPRLAGGPFPIKIERHRGPAIRPHVVLHGRRIAPAILLEPSLAPPRSPYCHTELEQFGEERLAARGRVADEGHVGAEFLTGSERPVDRGIGRMGEVPDALHLPHELRTGDPGAIHRLHVHPRRRHPGIARPPERPGCCVDLSHLSNGAGPGKVGAEREHQVGAVFLQRPPQPLREIPLPDRAQESLGGVLDHCHGAAEAFEGPPFEGRVRSVGFVKAPEQDDGAPREGRRRAHEVGSSRNWRS